MFAAHFEVWEGIRTNKVTELGDGPVEGGVSEFLVHVDEPSPGEILQNDAVVLDVP